MSMLTRCPQPTRPSPDARCRRCCRGGGLPLPPVRATLAALSEPGSVRTMCSLAASASAEGGETHDRFRDQSSFRVCRSAAWSATRCQPLRAVCLLPDRKVRVLATGQQAALGGLPWLPAPGNRRPGHSAAVWRARCKSYPSHAYGSPPAGAADPDSAASPSRFWPGGRMTGDRHICAAPPISRTRIPASGLACSCWRAADSAR
jgi:hypothetical protein